MFCRELIRELFQCFEDFVLVHPLKVYTSFPSKVGHIRHVYTIWYLLGYSQLIKAKKLKASDPDYCSSRF